MTESIKPKKYRAVVKALFDRPWAILPEKFQAIQELVELRSEGVELTADHLAAVTDSRRRPGQYAASGVAVIPLFGVLAQRMGMMEQMSGGTSTEAIGAAIRQAANDDAVGRIVLHVDSPGGDVFGTQELAAAIYDLRGVKPVTAIVDSMAASAAYWIASAAEEVIVTPGGMVGSIGVLVSHADTSAMDENLGIKRTILRMPDAKAEGAYGEPLSEDAVNHRLEMVAEYYSAFVGAVAKYRGVSIETVEQQFGRGRLVMAASAMSAGMVDRIAPFAEVYNSYLSGAPSTMTAQHPQPSNEPAVEPSQQTPATAEPTRQQPAPASAVFAAVKIATGIPVEQRMPLAERIIGQGCTHDQMIAMIGEEAAKYEQIAGPTHDPLAATESEADKFHAAARDAILTRSFGGRTPPQVLDSETGEYRTFQPARNEYRLASLTGLAEECAIRSGMDPNRVRQMSRPQLANLAITGQVGSGFFRAASDGPAYNVSGMFANVLLDAANVRARMGYDDTRTTFQVWMRQGESLPDFKKVHKIVSGETGDPRAIPENGEFEETTMSDAKESYRLTVWGNKFSLSWQMIVDDNLGEFMKVPAKMGSAMRRKQNRLAYGVLKDNPTMEDTGALFNATAQTTAGGHANLTTGAGAPSVTTLNALTKKMMEMKGLDVSTSAALNLMPRYLLAPPALRGTVLELLASVANPAVGGDTTGSSGVANIWQNGLEPVIEAELGAAASGGSDTAWYLATDVNEMEHVEYAYLQGLEAPALEREMSFDRLGIKYRIYQAFAVHPLEYRGMQKHAGA